MKTVKTVSLHTARCDLCPGSKDLEVDSSLSVKLNIFV